MPWRWVGGGCWAPWLAGGWSPKGGRRGARGGQMASQSWRWSGVGQRVARGRPQGGRRGARGQPPDGQRQKVARGQQRQASQTKGRPKVSHRRGQMAGRGQPKRTSRYNAARVKAEFRNKPRHISCTAFPAYHLALLFLTGDNECLFCECYVTGRCGPIAQIWSTRFFASPRACAAYALKLAISSYPPGL